MSTKFTEYKGLDLPKVADEILDYWEENNIFENRKIAILKMIKFNFRKI